MLWLRKIVDDPRTERVVMALIIANAVILGLETNRSLTPATRHALEIADYIILAIFVALSLKLHPASAGEVVDKIVATVNQEAITQSDIDRVIASRELTPVAK